MTGDESGAASQAVSSEELSSAVAERRHWMSVLAKAPAKSCAAAFAALELAPKFHWLRAPEIGTAMVRGRIGGSGAAFNIGETTITRCALQLEDGRVGHAYVAGRDREKARIAALCDALLQGEERALVARTVIAPLAALLEDRRSRLAEKAEKTRVDFFTMVRGEDE